MVPTVAIVLGLFTFLFTVFLRLILEAILPATMIHIIGTAVILTALALMSFFFTLAMVLRSPMARAGLFAIGLSLMYVGVVNWLPQITSVPPPQEAIAAGAMTPEQLVELGRKIVFGDPVPGQKSIGKGTCPLCHIFGQNDDPTTGRCPNLFGEAERANTRVAGAKEAGDCDKITVVDPRGAFANDEKKEDFKRECKRFAQHASKKDLFEVTESFKGAPRPQIGVEYIAESIICPGCFVVSKFGQPGSGDKVSPMPRIHKPPISLSLQELSAVVEFLLTKEGGAPMPQQEIEVALKKFIAPEDLAAATTAAAPGGIAAPKAAGEKVGDFFAALPEDLDPKQMIMLAGCNICHPIPGVTPGHDIGKTIPERILGPKLIEKVNATRRIASPEYQADVARAQEILAKGGKEAEELLKKGVPSAKTPRDYIRESIVFPDAHTVKCFKEGVMPCADANKAGDPPFPPGIMAAEGFGKKLTAGALEKLVTFILSIDDNGPGLVAENADIPVKTGPVFVQEKPTPTAPERAPVSQASAQAPPATIRPGG